MQLKLRAFLHKDETVEEREETRLSLAARRGDRTAADARWADADDGFSKQEWNPGWPITHAQVDRVPAAKPFEVLADFLASSAAARCFVACALIAADWRAGGDWQWKSCGRCFGSSSSRTQNDTSLQHLPCLALPARPPPASVSAARRRWLEAEVVKHAGARCSLHLASSRC